MKALTTLSYMLNKCGRKKSLKFNVTYKVNYALNHSRKVGMKPMRLDTMKLDYTDMYKEIILKENCDDPFVTSKGSYPKEVDHDTY